jgi:hypothetical protein
LIARVLVHRSRFCFARPCRSSRRLVPPERLLADDGNPVAGDDRPGQGVGGDTFELPDHRVVVGVVVDVDGQQRTEEFDREPSMLRG